MVSGNTLFLEDVYSMQLCVSDRWHVVVGYDHIYVIPSGRNLHCDCEHCCRIPIA